MDESPNFGNDHATALMKSVPSMMQRIAGKSLPIEKFAARKVKRYLAQHNRLVLPGYELMYVWNGFSVLGKFGDLPFHMPGFSKKHCPIIRSEIYGLGKNHSFRHTI